MRQKEYDNLLIEVKDLREKLVLMDVQQREYRQLLSKSETLFKDEIYKEYKALQTDRAKVRNELKYKKCSNY